MAYTKNMWHTGDPITLALMNNIEDGIEEALNKAANALSSADNEAATNTAQNTLITNLTAALGETDGRVAQINQKIGEGFDETSTVAARFAGIDLSLVDMNSNINTYVGEGHRAWILLIGAGVTWDSVNDVITTTLLAALDHKYASAKEVSDAAITPSSTDTVIIEGKPEDVVTLPRRIRHIYNALSDINTIIDHVKADNSDNTPLGLKLRIDKNEHDIDVLEDSVLGTSGQGVKVRLDALDGGDIQVQADLPSRNIKSIITEIANAQVSDVYLNNSNEPINYGTLEQRFKADELKIKDIETEIGDAHRLGLRNANDEPIDDTLDRRFDDIDGGNKPSRTLPSVISEVETARDGAASLHARLSAIDNTQDASSIIKRVETLEQTMPSKVNTSDIYSGLNIQEGVTGKVLDAQYGRVLNEKIGGSFTSENTVASHISNLETEIGNARPYTEDEQTGEITYGTLDDRFDTVEGRATQLETDVSAIETEINNAHVNNGTLDDRFDAIESAATELSADVTAIEGEIGDAHRDENDTLDARFDDIEGDITDLSNVIDHVHGENDELPNGLTQRITAIETSLTEQGGINDRLDAIDNASTGAIKTLQDVDSGLDTRVTTIETSLAGKVDSSDMTTALAEKANTTDVSLTIVKPKNEVAYTEGVPNTLQSWPIVERNDYLLQNATDNKYYYWKYIGNEWHLMGGAGSGGTGNTSGINISRNDYNALASTTGYAKNTDYYVTEDNGLIRHYRYTIINNTLTEIEIGPLVSNIKKYNISSGVQTVKVEGVDTDITYLYLHEFAYGQDNSEPDANTIITSIPLPAGGGGTTISSQKMVRITERNIVLPLGSVTPVELKFFYTSGIENESGVGQLYIDDIAMGEEFTVTSGDPKNASSTWPTVTQANPLPKGFYSIDISQYCTELGTLQFRIKISDPDDETGTMWKDLKWDVNVMNLTISSTFTEHSINALNSTVKFIYTANGDIDKVVNFKLGNVTLPSVNLSRSTSGVPQEYNIPMPLAGAGAYKLEVWLTATANGHDLPPSQSLYRDIIWYDSTSSNVIISSPYRNNVEEPVTQYDVVEIPYTIVGGTTPYTVHYYVDDMSTPIDEVTLSSNSGLWEYNANVKNIHTLKIECQSASITFSLDVAELKTDIAPVTTNLILDFNPQGITNSSAKRLWSNDDYHMSVSENFDWYNGGYGTDADGDYFLIKAGTRAIFDYKMFTMAEDENSNIVNEVFEHGKEFKIIFKTSAVRSADAVWFTNMGASGSNANAKLVGILLNAHNGWLKTNAASETAVGSGDDEVAATNTYLYFSYSEEDKIELDININLKSETSLFIMSYEDGCPSKAYPYKTSEILYHIEDETHTPSDITIGSDDCDVYIYRMRIYDAELSTEQVLRNFIADGKNSAESIKRYNRNCIYYDTNDKVFVPYAGNNTVLDPVRLAAKIPDIKVLMLETPQFTKSKKDFIPYSSLRCIHAPGGKVFPSRGKEDNWLFLNGYHAGQGTTSDKYGNAGRNLDFLFMCDGIHNPSDKVSVKKENFLPGYQSSLILGYGTDEQDAPKYCLDWKDEDTWSANKAYELTDNGHDTLIRYNGEVYKCIEAHTSTSEFDTTKWELQQGYTSKITLKSDSIPNNFFNLKVNIASSENANNALLQKRYNDFLPYVSPAKARDNRIKNDMEFVPAIIFVRETGSAVVDGQTITYERREFNDDQWHFYALGNIGDSKKTDYTRAYDPQDMNEFTLEISDNNTNNSLFQSGIYMASFYRPVEEPIIDNLSDYYVAGNTIGTVEVTIPNSAETETQYYGNFTKTLDLEIIAGTTYYTFIEKRRFVEPYTLEQDMDDGEPVEGSFTAMSAAGEGIQEVDYLFPIDYDTEWAAVDGEGRPINMRYWALFNEGFDGDHSFEMRYACKGDYRDGKVVNDTTGLAKAQLKINEKVWREFYTWLITSTDDQFVNELEQWCVKASVDFFYAFTHYYTMMDNRAKNTFWHFAKTGKHRRVTRPTKALLHIYEEADGPVTRSVGDPNVFEGNFITTSDITVIAPYFVDEYTPVSAAKFSSGIAYYTYSNNQYTLAEVIPGNDIPDNIAYYTHAYVLTDDTSIQENTTYYQLINNIYTVATVTVGDPIKQYYTQYAFDMWVYDTDTALGIDNNGELVFPYGKEDTDYRIANDPSSSNVFNGAGSVFWRRLRDNCKDDIRSIFTSVRSECFNANTLIQEFDLWQECYPEAIWRLDVERKYIRSYTGDKGPNDVYKTKKETRFLRDMMQGRKRYQRRQWSKDQDIYFGSKYMLPSVSDDFFEFSCYNPGGMAVTPNWDLTITPYQDMYINISYAETFANPFRARAGVTYEFKSILNTMNDSRIRIFGANHIQALAGKAKREDPNDPEKITGAEGLASFYIKANNFENGKKLRKLILGTDNPNYLNGNFTTLNIANDYPILEEFSIKNCNNLGGQLDFSKSTALKVIDAQGTKITQVLLPGSTGILALHLPETTQAIELRSAKQLDELTVNNRQGTQDLSNLARLDINDSDYSNNINWMNIAKLTLNHLDYLSLLGLRISSIVNIDELENFKTRKAAINRIYLGGNLTVTGAWSTIEKVTYENVWQDNNLNLLVDANNEVTRYKVVYYASVADMNAGRELYSLYLTPAPGTSSVSLGSDPVYTHIIPESAVIKTPTVSTEYVFGERNSYGYIAWTGWRKSTSVNPVRNDTSIDGDTNLIAVFNERTRSYPIHWYLHEGDSTPVKISEEVYYGDSYDGLEPTVYELKEGKKETTTIKINNLNCNYSIFNGWEKSPVNLDETFLNDAQTAFCIYGDWQGETNVPVSTILADATLTPRKLLLLSVYNDNLDLGSDLIEVNDTLDLTLGHDSKETGTLLIGEGSTYVMNDSRTYNPTVSFSAVGNPPAFASNIEPFNSNDGFTIAIDYRFDTAAIKSNWSNGYSALAGCYEKVGTSVLGFSLYYDVAEDAPRICFGDQSVAPTFSSSAHCCSIGDYTNSDMRNIVVLRHPAGSDYIQVYSGINSSSILNSLDNAFFVLELTYGGNSSAAKLCFGHVVPDGTSTPYSQLRAGLGTIYWAKYWNKDLGKSECIQLASWIHEKVRFAVEEYPNADKKIIGTNSKNIFFSALQLSQYGGPSFQPNSRGNTIGEIQSWADSIYRNISNKRFFLGLPIAIQSIINKTEGHASAVRCELGTYNTKYSYYTDYDVSDYVFLPAYPEVMGDTGIHYEGEALQGMPWRRAVNTKVISYINTSFNFSNPTTNVSYMNLRFPGVPITLGSNDHGDDATNVVYVGYTGTDPVYNKIGATRIKRGNILIYQDIAYIYANDEDVRNGAPIINAASGVFYCGSGGWVRSRPWWTRSVMEMDLANNTNSFYFVNNISGAVSSGVPTDEGRNGAWFTYTFGI